MGLIINLVVWGILLVITVLLWFYRRLLENREDRYLHLHEDERDAKLLQWQAAVAKRLPMISRARNILVIVLVLYAVAIVVVYHLLIMFV